MYIHVCVVHAFSIIVFFLQIQGDREYLIGVEGGKVTIAAKAVHGLMQLNQPNGQRENEQKDKGFIKALLISVCTLKKIQSMDENVDRIEKDCLNFIKGAYILLLDKYIFISLQSENKYNFLLATASEVCNCMANRIN